ELVASACSMTSIHVSSDGVADEWSPHCAHTALKCPVPRTKTWLTVPTMRTDPPARRMKPTVSSVGPRVRCASPAVVHPSFVEQTSSRRRLGPGCPPKSSSKHADVKQRMAVAMQRARSAIEVHREEEHQTTDRIAPTDVSRR